MKRKLQIHIVIPVYNEQQILEKNILKLNSFLRFEEYADWQITIADNASTDNTPVIAQRLAKNYSNVHTLHLDQKGMGLALKKASYLRNSDIICYIDADLSTGISYLPKLVSAITNGSAIATGNRYDAKAVVKRHISRTILSRCYNVLAKMIIRTEIKDLQCGFKAISRQAKEEILPNVDNNLFFFYSELLIWAEKMGYNIAEVPVIWKESERRTKIDILNTAKNYILDLFRLRKRLKIKGLL